MRKKALFIAYIFPPLARAGVHRTVRFTRYLPEMGWDITVLTVAEPHYPPQSPVDRELLNNSRRRAYQSTPVFQGLENLFRMKDLFRRRPQKTTNGRETETPRTEREATKSPELENITPRAQSAKRGVKQRAKDLMYDLITTPDKEINWLPYALKRALNLHRRERFDLIYSTAPPFTAHLLAKYLKRMTGLPWVADFRDPWARAPWKSEILAGSWRGKVAARLEREFVERADRVILNTDWNAREFSQHYGGKLARKFAVITNGFDPQDFAGLAGQPERNSKMILTHTGALYRRRNPLEFFQACENLLAGRRISPQELEIRFIGVIAPELYKSFEGGEQLRKVITVMPQVSHREALQYQMESDVLLILQPGTSVSVPGKIFEYIGMRKRILALTPAGATADIVRENDLGPVLDPEDIPSIEKALLGLIEEFRNGGIQTPSANGAFKKYDGIELARQLHEEFLQGLEHGRRA
jgi:glycosyltransferase involved in cell wall biosynthesis